MAEVFTLDSDYLTKKRNGIKNDIASARYKVGSTWYNAAIQSVSVLTNGAVECRFLIDHAVSGNITVTAVELYDHNGSRIGAKTVSITRADAQEGLLYAVTINLFQVVEAPNNTGAYDAL